MLPEMAVVYGVGLLPNLALAGLHLELHRRKSNRPSTRLLQRNLAKAGFQWSEAAGKIVPFENDSQEKDKRSYRRSVFILAGLCLFLSWLGFLAQLLVMISLRYLAVSRMEERLFSSRLAREDLAEAEVERLVAEWRGIDPHGFLLSEGSGPSLDPGAQA